MKCYPAGRHHQSMRSQLKWAAELSHVREISLRGTAELDFWRRRLAEQDLSPAESERRAQILIVAAGAKFRGIRFSELSVSVLVSPPNPSTGEEAAYLLHAFNSNGFFAFCERVFFATP